MRSNGVKMHPRLICAAVVLGICFGAVGCSRQPEAVAPAPRTRALSRDTSALSAVAGVQSLPEYARAKAACKRGQYLQAAQILARLATSPTLSAEQKAFTRTQQQICLNHGNPVAHATPLSYRPSTLETVGASDCGPRALLLVCQKLGVQVTLPTLTKAAGTGPRGTSLAGLKSASEALKLRTEALQVSREALPDLPTPAIAWVHGNHYVALLGLQGRGEEGTATIHDPNAPGEQTISQEQLLQESSGYLLTVQR